MGEGSILIGDLNKHIGNIVPDNKDKISPGGKLVRELLKNKNHVLVNASKKAEGGPFTRYDPGKPDDDALKSCLDLVILYKKKY